MQQDDRKKKEEYRWIEDKPYYFVILSNRPKITGHTLIVSKKHYLDITELRPDSKEATSILNGLVKWSRKIKDILGPEKVYIMSMCDHWQPDELPKGTKETTEHLHFHLLPRYETNRSERGERFFTREEETGYETRRFVLEMIKNLLETEGPPACQK